MLELGEKVISNLNQTKVKLEFPTKLYISYGFCIANMFHPIEREHIFCLAFKFKAINRKNGKLSISIM